MKNKEVTPAPGKVLPSERPPTIIPAEFVKKMIAPQLVDGTNTYPNWFWASDVGARKQEQDVPRDKWARCVHDVQDKSGDDYNAYAVCTAQLGTPTKKQSEAAVSSGFPQLLRPKKK